MKPKSLMIFFLCLLGLCLSLFYMIYAGAKESAIAELNHRQEIHARQAKRGLEYFFNDLVAYLTKVAGSSHIVTLDEQGLKELGFALNLFPEAITAISRVDATGKITYTLPYAEGIINKDISGQNHVKKILTTHTPVASDVFSAVQGYRAIALHIPIFDKDEFCGTLGALIDFETISKRFLQDIKPGETGYAWMMSHEGIELYCPVPEHTGKSVFENSKAFPGILSMADQMVAGKQGVTTYLAAAPVSDPGVEKTKQHAVYLPIQIVDSFWTIVVASSENDVLAGLVNLKNKLILVVGLLLFASSIFSYYGMKSWGIVREADKRRKAEKSLEESQKNLAVAQEIAHIGSWKYHVKTRELYGSDELFSIYGLSPDKPKNRLEQGMERIHPEDKTAAEDAFKNAFKQGEPFKIEYRIIRTDGEERFLQSIGKIETEPSGDVVSIYGTSQDITDRRQAEEALKERTAFLDKIIETSALSLWISDEKGTAIRANPACLSLFGATREEVIGKYNLFKDSVLEKNGVMPFVKDVFKKGVSESFVIDYDFGAVAHVEIKNPTHKTIKAVLTPVMDGNNRVSNVIVQAIDLTEIKQSEQETVRVQKIMAEHEKLSLVGQVAGKMAHDFNNVLGIIMGNTELSLLDCKDARTKKTLELIYAQTIRGKNLTKNLVAFAKDQEPKQEFFRLNEKIDLVINLLKKDLEGIEMIRKDKPGVPELLADPGMIEHALVNLIQNAIHATSRVESPVISLGTYCLEGDICFEIEDNGCGIPKEHLQHIFEPSFTLKGSKDVTGSYESTIKGTGYGMSNVKKYVDLHRGTIQVDSTLDSGTKFSICLPVIKKELTREEKTELWEEIVQVEKHILLVEDETSISDIQYRVLTQEPCCHTVDIASSGQAAMDLFDRNRYDLVSLDYILPGKISGMDVYHHIRKTNPHLPILFISGNIEFLESVKSLKQKDTHLDHQSKPCQNKAYIKSINQLLEKSFG